MEVLALEDEDFHTLQIDASVGLFVTLTAVSQLKKLMSKFAVNSSDDRPLIHNVQ